MVSTQRLVRVAPIAMQANDPFRRFKPEVAQPVRQADVTGQSYTERVKRTKEMLRSLVPEKALSAGQKNADNICQQVDKASELIEFRKDLNFLEALTLAQREGKLIVPNDIHDRILMETKDSVYFIQNYPVWTGTLVIYVAPDKKFDKNVVFSWNDYKDIKYSISFEVPKQFRGKKNCALVVEHPDFEVVGLGTNRYELKVDVQSIRLIQDFPERNGWYMPDAETGIPHGKEVEKSSDARHLWRITSGSYLGLLCRGFVVVDGYGRQVVGAGYRFTDRFGVAFFPVPSDQLPVSRSESDSK